MPNSIQHILVIRLSAMGDVAMSVPVLRAFVSQYPKVKVTVLTRPFFTPFFETVENVEVYPVDLHKKHKGIFGLYKLSKEIKNLKVDAIADLHNVLRSKIVKMFLREMHIVQIDKGRKEKKEIITGKRFEQLKSTHQRYADVFAKLGFEINLENPDFPLKSQLNYDNIDHTKKLIGVAPFAAFESKIYPLDMMEKVIEELSKRYQILLFGGGKNEIELLSELEEKYENVINLAGEITLKKELEIISNLDLMISMDSGNAHLGAMQGVEVLTFWGVTHPFLGFYPFNQPKENALLVDRAEFSDIPTSVYGNKYPEGYKNILDTITPESVVAKVESIIKNGPTKE